MSLYYCIVIYRARWECYFTSDSTMKKEKFMQQINFSHSEGGLTCSFNDYQLSEYIQHRRRNTGKLPVKHAVDHVGPQPDGSWVLGPSLFISITGARLKIQMIPNTPGLGTCTRDQGLPVKAVPVQSSYHFQQVLYGTCMLGQKGTCTITLSYACF